MSEDIRHMIIDEWLDRISLEPDITDLKGGNRGQIQGELPGLVGFRKSGKSRTPNGSEV